MQQQHSDYLTTHCSVLVSCHLRVGWPVGRLPHRRCRAEILKIQKIANFVILGQISKKSNQLQIETIPHIVLFSSPLHLFPEKRKRKTGEEVEHAQ